MTGPGTATITFATDSAFAGTLVGQIVGTASSTVSYAPLVHLQPLTFTVTGDAFPSYIDGDFTFSLSTDTVSLGPSDSATVSVTQTADGGFNKPVVYGLYPDAGQAISLAPPLIGWRNPVYRF
jgi:hypothetical protein